MAKTSISHRTASDARKFEFLHDVCITVDLLGSLARDWKDKEVGEAMRIVAWKLAQEYDA